MMQPANQILSSLKIGQPATSDKLTIYPIMGAVSSESDLVDLDQAISEGWIEVTEVSETGHVPELMVLNHSPHHVVIFDGEELIGAKQNRIVNVTIIVGPFAKVPIPVSCVEQGRWSWRSRHFSSGDFLYPSLRGSKFERVSESLRAHTGFRSDQRMIWEDIAAKLARMEVRSDTGALRDIADRYYVDDSSLSEEFPHGHNQVGYLAFIRGGFAGGDVFSSTGISKRKFTKLLRSYRLDSLDPELSFPELQAEGILNQVRSSASEPVESVGIGEERRFESEGLQGSITLLRDQMIHMAVFPKIFSRGRR